MKIVIPGGTGQVGQILARHFHQQGHQVTVLSRKPHAAPWRVIPWDGVTLGPWIEELERCGVCINLAGKSVNCRYTPANRRSIFESRVRSTEILNQAIAAIGQPPSVWLNASMATIYRHALDRPMDEATGEFVATSQTHPIPGTSQFGWRKLGKKHSSPSRLLGRGR
jgi:NAD dependent epimerase/dehydratase family enzyme